MEALVQEAIDFASENPEPIAGPPKEEEGPKARVDGTQVFGPLRTARLGIDRSCP